MPTVADVTMERLYDVKQKYASKNDYGMTYIFDWMANLVSELSKSIEDGEPLDKELIIYRKGCINLLKSKASDYKINESKVESAIGLVNEATCASSFRNLQID